jgi:hypothetical protein
VVLEFILSLHKLAMRVHVSFLGLILDGELILRRGNSMAKNDSRR